MGRKKKCLFFHWTFIWFLSVCNISSCTELYSLHDNIVLLNTNSFNKTVLGKPYPWLVEFYSSWCGHCIRYAPIYKQLAYDVKEWQPLVTVAAIDCAADENAPLCREYSITQYPTLSWFPAHSLGHVSMVPVKEFDVVVNARHSIIDLLQSNFDAANINQTAERVHNLLTPLSNFEDIFNYGTAESQQYFIVNEPEDSYIGREVILDVMSYEQLVVRRMYDSTIKNAVLHSVSMVNGEAKLKPVFRKLKRKELVLYLRRLVPLKSGTLIFKSTQGVESRPVQVYNAEYRNASVHQQDLESGLHYSLRREVAMSSVIEGEKLAALQGYVEALAKYMPVRRSIRSFLRNLHSWLLMQDSFTGAQWLSQIEALQMSGAYLPAITRWTGCQGSQLRFRGYPCSLWTTFHTLLEAASTAHDASMDTRQVLLRIRGYVQHFFGCRECSEHFMKVAGRVEELVHSDDDAVLFLWRAHNQANGRLRGDPSEDPHHPKVQFPSASHCPTCRLTGENGKEEWNEVEVLRFLHVAYSEKNIVLDSDPLVLMTGSTRRSPIARRVGSFSSGVVSVTSIDIGLCFAFYLLCALFLIFLYCLLSRRYSLTSAVRRLQFNSV